MSKTCRSALPLKVLSDLFSDHVEEDLAEDSVKFVDSLKIRENSLTPVGFLVVPKSSCFCNHPSLAMDRLGLELELARRQCWKTVIVSQ